MKALYTCLLLSCLALVVKGQTFEILDLTGAEEIIADSEYGNGISLHDIDRDGWVDLTICQHNTDPLFFHNLEGSFIPWDLGITSSSILRQFNWVDIDNDGDADASLTSSEGYIRIWLQTGPLQFEEITESTGFMDHSEEVYGHTWGDFDRDGLLDCYFPVYDTQYGQVNALYHNLGENTFVNVAADSPVNDGVNASFNGVFADFNNDMWPDLHVINDRLVSDNHLYKNNEGVFEDISGSSGTDLAFFTMSNTIGDINNDGLLDIFMTNNPEGHVLLVNQGDETFEDISALANIQVFEFGWAGNFSDFDNDGFIDLHICSEPFWAFLGQNRMFHNNGNSTFTEVTDASGMGGQPTESYSSAVGDIDNDGLQDIVVLNDEPFGLQIWHNTSNNLIYKWIKVKANGVLSNRDAIGARIEVYSEGQVFTRYTFCGESYLTQNSLVQHIGLGVGPATVDSLLVSYPSGHVDHYYDLAVNTCHNLTEGETLPLELEPIPTNTLCYGETITLTTTSGVPVTWQDGTVAVEYVVDQSGSYYASFIAPSSFELHTDTLEIVVMPEINYGMQVDSILCDGGSGSAVIVPLTSGLSITWDDPGFTGWSAANLVAGTYAFTISNDADCSVSGSIGLTNPDAINVETEIQNVSCFGFADGNAMVFPTGGTGELSVDWGLLNPEELPAGTYDIIVSDENDCQLTLQFLIEEPEVILAEWEVSDVLCSGEASGSIEISVSGGSGSLEISAEDLDLDALSAGSYSFDVTDGANCIQTFEFDVLEPDPILVEILELNDDANGVFVDLTITGGVQPYTILWSDGVSEWTEEDPYLPLEAVIDLLVSDSNDCEVSLTWTDVMGHEQPPLPLLYPNPATEMLYIQYRDAAEVRILDGLGRNMLSALHSGTLTPIDIHSLSSGTYFLELRSEQTLITIPWVKR